MDVVPPAPPARPDPTAAGRRWLVPLAALIVVVGVLVTAGSADAHRNDESYLYLDVGDRALTGRVEMPYRDMREVFGLRLSGAADEILAELEANLDELQAYALDKTTIGADGVSWPITFDGVELLFDEAVGPNGLGYAILPFTVDLAGQEVPQAIEVMFTPFLAEIDDRNNITLVSNDWKRGIFDQETNELLLHTPESPTGTIDLGDSSQWKNFDTSIDLGVDHIRTGPDHIFFVIILLLPSVLVLVTGRWRPAPKFSRSLLQVVLVATMFTVAHSLTFTLAGLDILPLPPSKVVETLIAASIAAAALYNIKPIFGQREWVIAFGFGLFHGMGFAGLVQDLDINRATQLVSLLGRNFGIEIGQLVIIAMTFPVLFILRRTRAYMPIFYAASGTLAVLSGIWIIERIWEVDAGISDGIDRVVLWPRSLYVMMVITALAAIYREIEARRGALLPVGAPTAATAATDARPATDDDLDEPEYEPVPV